MFRRFARLPRAAVVALSSFLLAGFSTPPAFALDPLLPPSGNFDLAHWYLTLPSGAAVPTSDLSHGYTLPKVFYTDGKGGMVFRCPNLAGTTKSSSYSRTELRETLTPWTSMTADSNNWTTAIGGTMKARLKVDRVSVTGEAGKVGRVIIGQIHGPSSEVIRLYYAKKPGEAKGRIFAGMDSFGNVTSYSPDIVGNRNGDGIALGELFTYTIRLKGTQLYVEVRRGAGNGIVNSYARSIDPGYVGQNLYFKAGVYNQNNTGDASDYAQATFHSLTHTHP